MSRILFTVGGASASVHAGIPPPGTRHPPPQSRPPGTRHPPCAVNAGRYSHQAGGMHPTGMQFCFYLFCNYFHISTKTFLGICLLSTVLNQSPFLGVLFLYISEPAPIPGCLVSLYISEPAPTPGRLVCLPLSCNFYCSVTFSVVFPILDFRSWKADWN